MHLPLPIPLGKFQGSWVPWYHAPPILAADWLGRLPPLLSLVLPLCHPLGAGPSAGDVPINPTVRGKEGGNFTFPSRFTLILMPWIFCFFKKKKYIYIFGFGGKEIFFSFGFDKIEVWEFLNAIALGLPHLGQLFKRGYPIRWGACPHQGRPSFWLLPLFYMELRCCNFLEPHFFHFFI